MKRTVKMSDDGKWIIHTINIQTLSAKPTIKKCFVCGQSLNAAPKRKRAIKDKSPSTACNNQTKVGSDKLPPSKNGIRAQFLTSNKKSRQDARSVPYVHEHIEADGFCINRTKVGSDKLPPCKSVSTPLYIPRTKKTLRIKRPRDNAKTQKALPSGEFTATNKVLGY